MEIDVTEAIGGRLRSGSPSGISCMPLRMVGAASAAIRELSLRLAISDAKCRDPSAVARSPFLQIIADVPDGAIIGRVDGRLGVVFPAIRILLGRLSFDHDRFAQRQ